VANKENVLKLLSNKAISRWTTRFHCKLRCELGQGVAEYVIILAVIVIACIALAIIFRGQLVTLWESITGEFGTISAEK
ncbi:MAG: hypothetical protein FWD93_01570, partial [Coriobacteriia bacterium]|nr:hypothetical protein [Coriobacteriia bacterium]